MPLALDAAFEHGLMVLEGEIELMLEGETLLWWNFVGRTSEEIAQYALDWNAGGGSYGRVEGFEGPRLVAPELLK